MADYFLKYPFIALILFIVYNEFVMMYRPSAFEKIALAYSKADVTDAIGEPKYIYQCSSGQTPPVLYTYIEKLCLDKVQEVDAYPMCLIPLRCPGWHYVGYDKDGKVVTKYHFGN